MRAITAWIIIISSNFLFGNLLCKNAVSADFPENFHFRKSQKQPSRGVLKKSCSENMQQLYWNRTFAWVISCKFAAYFQNTFPQEHLWTAASEISKRTFFNCWVIKSNSFHNSSDEIWHWLNFSDFIHFSFFFRFFQNILKAQGKYLTPFK